MTKIDTKKALCNFEGEELKEKDDKGIDRTVTVGDILRRSCLISDGQAKEEKTTDEEKCQCWTTAMEITKSLKGDGIIELEATTVTLLRKQLSRAYSSPLIIGQVLPILK